MYEDLNDFNFDLIKNQKIELFDKELKDIQMSFSVVYGAENNPDFIHN